MENKLGIAGRLAKIFVHNQRLGLLVVLLLFFAGSIFFMLTPKQYNPEITAPAFNIITQFPGASSLEVEQYLSKPIEDVLKDIKGVDEVLSQSIDGGMSVVTVKFFVGEESENSKIKLIQKIYGNLDLKPMGAMDPLIKEINLDDVPVLTIAVTSEYLDEITLRQVVLSLRDHLKLVEGASNLEVTGGRMPEFAVKIDPQLLLARKISVGEVIAAIQSSNQRVLIDTIDSEQKSEVFVFDGAFKDINELSKLPISNDAGSIVYLEDVADVSQGSEEINSYVRYRDSLEHQANTVFLSVAKRNGENVSSVTESILDELEVFKKNEQAKFLHFEVVRNEGETANEEISGLTFNLISSVLIVAFVLFLFLGSGAAFVVAITIPLTLLSVFAIGYLSGQTINRITLFALILSLGLLVDNATVVIENIIRHVGGDAKKEDYPRLVTQSVDEVGQGLIMSTVTTLLAFFPMAFVTGMMGPYMGPIPFFVPAALTVSLILAFTINPFLSLKILSRKKPDKPRVQFKRVTDFFAAAPHYYEKSLKKIFGSPSLQKKIVWISLLLFLISMALPLFGIVKFRMLPKADRNQFYLYMDMPDGTQVEELNDMAILAENFFLKQEYVKSVQSFVGTAPIIDFNGLFKGAGSRVSENQATLKINLLHNNERKIKSEDYVMQLRESFSEEFKPYPDLDVQFIEDPPGPPVLSTFLLKIQGENQQALPEISKEIYRILMGIDGLVDLETSYSNPQYELNYKVNYDKLSYYGLTYAQVSNTLLSAYSSINVGVAHDSALEQHFIRLQFADDVRESEQDLSQIFLKNARGEYIPLSELVEISYDSAEQVIYHDGRSPTVYLYGEMGDRSVTYAGIDALLALRAYKLPSGEGEMVDMSLFGLKYQDSNGDKFMINFGGEWELTLEVFRDLGLAMMVAIFLIYFVLVGQFHSFSVPMLVMVTIPLSLIGVMPGFAILGMINGLYFNATSMIGVIALAGIVVNNAIILVDYIDQLRKEGGHIGDILMKAGMTRLRPILLTSATTILGSLTIVSDPVWAGLAWSIIFGLSISTVLTLVVFPTLYYIVEEHGIRFLFFKHSDHGRTSQITEENQDR